MVSSSTNNKSSRNVNNKNQQQKTAKISRSSEFGIQKPLNNASNQMKPIIESSPDQHRKNNTTTTTTDDNFGLSDSDSAYPMLESDDVELQAIIDYVDEYYYGVRLFPGQDGSKVYVGWTTSRFHLSPEKLDKTFNQKDLSKCTLINTSSDGSIVSKLVRNECYIFSAIDLSQALQDAEFSSSKIVANSVLIGCMADLSTGIISFTFNGKETGQKLQIEPGTKLYPAVFVEPTTKEVLQLELGRVRNCLPLSAALFPSLGKHVTPKCPPRLRLQYLEPIRWTRVPNMNLKVHCLKMNNILGWSMLCEENGMRFF
jgi:ryanodine receptor 2